MKKSSEILLLIIVAIPFLYMAYKWNQWPDEVPVHYNIKGEPDRWGSKWELVIIPILLPLLTYGIFKLVPIIDPKNKIQEMGSKYEQLKFFFVGFMSALATYIIWQTDKDQKFTTEVVFLMMGFMWIILGNYLPSVKPNYFIGIRTPWTLENDQVWLETHRLGGKIFLLLGLLTIVLTLTLSIETYFAHYFAVVVIAALYLLWFSYNRYKELQNE